MDPIFILIIVSPDGAVRASMTTNPEIPNDMVKDGEIAFILQPVDVLAKHSHPQTPLPGDTIGWRESSPRGEGKGWK